MLGVKGASCLMENTAGLSNVTVEYLKIYEKILKKMMHEMSDVKITCSISDNFIQQILPHQRAAIEMSENILRLTTNLGVQDLALCIAKEQKENIKKMKAIQYNCCFFQNSPYEVYDYMYGFVEIAEMLFYEMCSAPISNSVNVNFLQEMILHTTGGLQLAYNVLRFCICQELIPILQDIIQTQYEEIELMYKLLGGLRDC